MKTETVKVLNVIRRCTPTTERMKSIWPWCFYGIKFYNSAVMDLIYGGSKIERLLFTIVKTTPTVQHTPICDYALMYPKIDLIDNLALYVIQFEDKSLWEVLTSFTPKNEHHSITCYMLKRLTHENSKLFLKHYPRKKG